MARKPKLWKWTAGSYGATVKVFERVPGGPLYIGVPLLTGGYRRVSLGHTDREQAMRDAAALAAKRQAGDGQPTPISLADVFALFLSSVEGKQSAVHAADTKRAAEMWNRYLGSDFRIERFGPTHWEAFCRLRASGELDPRGRVVPDAEKREPVGPRAVAKDLKALRAACRRATIERTPSGGFVLTVDPTRGLSLPVERNPRRPVYDVDRVDALMAVADRIQMRVGRGKAAAWVPSPLPTLFRLAADTGRRISAILALRASDWRPDLGTYGRIRWRADSDKVGKEWWAPVTPEVREELEAYRREHLVVGEALFFPSPSDAAKALCAQVVTEWLKRAEKLAELEPAPGGAWHPFRRKWATERKHMSPKDTAAVGGWTDTATLIKCYQAVDDATMEDVILQPKRLRKLG
jgi:integrase